MPVASGDEVLRFAQDDMKPVFSTEAAVPRRAISFDSTWILWIAIIAVLLFLVVSPFIYLVVTSFTAERTAISPSPTTPPPMVGRATSMP